MVTVADPASTAVGPPAGYVCRLVGIRMQQHDSYANVLTLITFVNSLVFMYA